MTEGDGDAVTTAVGDSDVAPAVGVAVGDGDVTPAEVVAEVGDSDAELGSKVASIESRHTAVTLTQGLLVRFTKLVRLVSGSSVCMVISVNQCSHFAGGAVSTIIGSLLTLRILILSMPTKLDRLRSWFWTWFGFNGVFMVVLSCVGGRMRTSAFLLVTLGVGVWPKVKTILPSVPLRSKLSIRRIVRLIAYTSPITFPL